MKRKKSTCNKSANEALHVPFEYVQDPETGKQGVLIDLDVWERFTDHLSGWSKRTMELEERLDSSQKVVEILLDKMPNDDVN